MLIRPRPEVERITTIPHGGFESGRPPGLLDFSANVNPFGPSPRIWEAMREVPIDQHPDPRAAPLRNLLAEIEGLDARQILVGNGAVDLIYQVAVAYLRAGDRVLIVQPTFGEYANAAAIMGAEIVALDTRVGAQHAVPLHEINLDALQKVARESNPRVIFLCNPNNPTGTYLECQAIEQLRRACPDTLVVLDQVFVRFVADAWSSREWLPFDNLILLRSLTKDYALTGLRVGYAMASTNTIAALEKVQPPWSVNALAQAAAMAALRDEDHLRTSLAALARAKEDLVRDLTQLGMTVFPSRVHFFLMHVGSAFEFTQRLLERQILVRDGTSFGLPEFVRIAARRPSENARLVEAIAQMRRG